VGRGRGGIAERDADELLRELADAFGVVDVAQRTVEALLGGGGAPGS
jgi:hypothetical protein